MATIRASYHTLTSLSNGKALVAGGTDDNDTLSSVELFDSGITLPDNGGGGGGGGGCTITIPRVRSNDTSGIAYVLILAIPAFVLLFRKRR
jgi:hypothetical protein